MKLIEELAKALLMSDQEFEQYLNRETGEIIMRRNFYDEDDFDEEDEEQLILIPQISSPEAYDLMVMFSKEQSEDLAFALTEVLNQPRPFAKFKDKIHELGIHNEWCAFEDEYAKQRMIDWLYEIGVSTNIRDKS